MLVYLHPRIHYLSLYSVTKYEKNEAKRKLIPNTRHKGDGKTLESVFTLIPLPTKKYTKSKFSFLIALNQQTTRIKLTN